MSEPAGRGAAWTEERGTSDEGRRRLKGAPKASGEQSMSEPARLKGAPKASGEQRDLGVHAVWQAEVSRRAAG
jgi:hypothetical protein